MGFLLSKTGLSLIGGGLAILAVLWWYNGQIKAAYEKGYAQRQTEVIEAHLKVVAEMQEENDRLRSADNVRVETVVEERIKTEKVIEYVDREIQVMDTACVDLGPDWLRIHNAASSNCSPESGADSCEPEDALSGPLAVR